VLAEFCKTRALASYKVAKVLEHSRLSWFDCFKWRYSKDIGEASFLFHWAVARQRERYRRDLKTVERRAGAHRFGSPRASAPLSHAARKASRQFDQASFRLAGRGVFGPLSCLTLDGEALRQGFRLVQAPTEPCGDKHEILALCRVANRTGTIPVP